MAEQAVSGSEPFPSTNFQARRGADHAVCGLHQGSINTIHIGVGDLILYWAFYLHAIMKDWPNHHATKKLFRTAVSNFIFDYTRVPFHPHSVRFVTLKMSSTWVLDRKMSLLPL